MYMYMRTSPSSPLAPSDVSSPLVVMATNSSITVTRGPQRACWGSPDHDLQRAGTTDDTSDCSDRFATSNHIFGLHVHIYTCSGVYCWWSRGGAAISTLEFGKQEIDGHPPSLTSKLPHPFAINIHTQFQLECSLQWLFQRHTQPSLGMASTCPTQWSNNPL